MEPRHGTKGDLYELHKPDLGQRTQVGIVFIPGLQMNNADLMDNLYKGWTTSGTTSDGKEVWIKTWLKQKYPNARILLLAFKSPAPETGAAKKMSLHLLSKRLLDQMVSTPANIGQNDYPVVFVCHSLGGLIAKEIVVRCTSDRENAKYQNLLHNLKAVFFYATPHGGCRDLDDFWITKIADCFPFVEKSSLVGYLNPKGKHRTRTQEDFLKAVSKDCKFYVVAEGRKSNLVPGYKKWIVHEDSARLPVPHEFVMLLYADHITVCKPQNKEDRGYLMLIKCIDELIGKYRRSITVDRSVDPVGIEGKIAKISELLESPEVSIVGLFGIPGVGKSTLIKSFYNLNAFEYEKSCYLELVNIKSVQDVQRELLQGLCSRQDLPQCERVDMIKDCLMTKKVLLVIDDVISVECLQELQVFHALGSQSKVVVAGQDSAILQSYLDSGKVVIEAVNGIEDREGCDLKFLWRRLLLGVLTSCCSRF